MANKSTLIGEQIGRYRIVAQLGRGGMAHVYQAQLGSRGRMAALKALDLKPASGPTTRKRFRREVEALKKLKHPHIVKYYDFLEVPSGDFLVLEFIDGTTLKDRLDDARRRGRRLPARTIVRIVQQTASALDYAHRRRMIHRDVKPANILLDRQGNVHLTDFGLVYMQDASQHTSSDVIVGTPQYIAPEQAMASHNVCPQTDVYSLGICVYEMLTHTPPFRGDTPINVVLQHIQQAAPSPRTVDRRIPVRVERVLLKALRKDPADRYASPTEFAEALAGALLPQPKPVPPARRATAKRGRPQARSKATRPAAGAVRWGLVVAGLLLVLILMSGLGQDLGTRLGQAISALQIRDTGSDPDPALAGDPPDFRLVTVRLLGQEESSCQNLVPVFHLRTLDPAGLPIDNVRLDVFWNEGRVPDLNSGWNGPGYVKATLSRGTFQARVLGDVPPFGDASYTSDVTPPLSTVSPPPDLLGAAGYCSGDQCRQCATYSYEIVFQRQW